MDQCDHTTLRTNSTKALFDYCSQNNCVFFTLYRYETEKYWSSEFYKIKVDQEFYYYEFN